MVTGLCRLGLTAGDAFRQLAFLLRCQNKRGQAVALNPQKQKAKMILMKEMQQAIGIVNRIQHPKWQNEWQPTREPLNQQKSRMNYRRPRMAVTIKSHNPLSSLILEHFSEPRTQCLKESTGLQEEGSHGKCIQ